MVNEIDHNDLRYSGPAGENVRLTVEAQQTTQLVEFTLEGDTKKLTPGDDITFTLVKKPNDESMKLQFVLDFNANDGAYIVTVQNVSNCVKDTAQKKTCVHKFVGPNMVIKDYQFFAD